MKFQGVVRAVEREQAGTVHKVSVLLDRDWMYKGDLSIEVAPGRSRAYQVGRKVEIEVKPK